MEARPIAGELEVRTTPEIHFTPEPSACPVAG